MLNGLEKKLAKYNVANRYEKKKLLTIVNLVAGLSIFFFGYDQGVMGGVNTTRDYVRRMKIGHYDEQAGLVVVDHSLQQGGIVSRQTTWALTVANIGRMLFTTFLEHWSDA